MKKSQPYMITRVLYRDFCAAFARDPRTAWIRERHGKLCVTQFNSTIKMYLAKGGAEANVSIAYEKVNGKWKNPYNKDTKTIKVRVYGVEKLAKDGNSYSGIVYEDNQEVDGYSFDDTSWMTEDDAELRESHEILKEAKRLLAKYEPDINKIDRMVALTVPEITVEQYKEREEKEAAETVPAGACAPACCSSTQTAVSSPSSVPADSSPIVSVPAVVPVRPVALRSRRRLAQRAHFPRRLIPCTTANTAHRKGWRYQLPRARPCGFISIAYLQARGCTVLSSSPFGFISIGPLRGTGMKIR